MENDGRVFIKCKNKMREREKMTLKDAGPT